MRTQLSVARMYAVARATLETRIREWKDREPDVHAGDVMAPVLLRQDRALWAAYRAGIAAGWPAEFDKVRPVRTPADRLREVIQQEARARVARAKTPLTLRQAVRSVERDQPELHAAYVAALQRSKQRSPSRTRKRG